MALAGNRAVHATPADNFRICVAADDEDFRTPQIVLPPGLIFLSWGHLIGDLTNPTPDPTGMVDEQGHANNDHYAIVITKQVVITKSRRCATTTAVVALSPTDGWNHRSVLQNFNLYFQAFQPVHFSGDWDVLPNHLGDYLVMGILNGTPIADIRDTMTLPDTR